MTPWRQIGLIVAPLLLTGCASSGSGIIPPVTVAPRLADSASPDAWLLGLVNAYRDNCVTLMVLRHESPAGCRQP